MPKNKDKRTPSSSPSGQAEAGHLSSLLEEVYQRLYQRYGPQGWWPGDGPFDVVIGAILTQSAAWGNVERAIAGLKQADCWSIQAIHVQPVDELASIIRSCGYFNAKARKLKAFAEHVMMAHSGSLTAMLNQDLAPLREELLSIHGVGPETADDILVYAAHQPSFVIDSYTVKILGRMGIGPPDGKAGYPAYQSLFHRNLPSDALLFNEYHALLDQHAKAACGKVPKCSRCCLADVCATGISMAALNEE